MLFIEFDMCSVYIATPSTELVPATSVDAMETIRRVTEPSVSTLFASMEYGPAKESRKVADSWLDKHQRHFGLFINMGLCCCAESRILVEDDIYDEFVEQLVERGTGICGVGKSLGC